MSYKSARENLQALTTPDSNINPDVMLSEAKHLAVLRYQKVEILWWNLSWASESHRDTVRWPAEPAGSPRLPLPSCLSLTSPPVAVPLSWRSPEPCSYRAR